MAYVCETGDCPKMTEVISLLTRQCNDNRLEVSEKYYTFLAMMKRQYMTVGDKALIDDPWFIDEIGHYKRDVMRIMKWLHEHGWFTVLGSTHYSIDLKLYITVEDSDDLKDWVIKKRDI